VVGINAAIKSRSGGFQGIGLAVSSNMAKNVIEQLQRDGVVRRGYLGVQIKDIVDPNVANRLGLKEGDHGVLVTRVFAKTPGARAGLKDGDVILNLDGKVVRDGHDLQTVVAGLPLGKPVAVAVLRDGKPQTLAVTIEEQPRDYGNTRVTAPRVPETEADTVPLDKVGLEVVDLTPDLADNLGYAEGTKGAVITKVSRDSVSGLAGLRRGWLISKVDKKAVASAKELKDALATAALDKGVLLQVQSPQGGTNFVLLKTGAAVNP
jgi:serine protease Do